MSEPPDRLGPPPIVLPGSDSPEVRSDLATADVIIGSDPAWELRTLFYGREVLEEIARSGVTRELRVATVELDLGSADPEEFDAVVRSLKGDSCFRPVDLFPEIEIDVASFDSPDLLAATRSAVEEIRTHHRTLLPEFQRRFYYAVRTAGFKVASEEVRLAAERTDTPQAHIECFLALGELLYHRLPAGVIRPDHKLDMVHTGADDHRVQIRCRRLGVRSTPTGPAYFSRRKPQLRFRADGTDRMVAFSQHALERVCERTVYDWRTFSGHGDAFAFLDNCVYYEDCSTECGQPCFALYDSCVPHFASWLYVEHVLGTPEPGKRYYYRVGYCPISFHGDTAKAITLLVPGMKGTPERKLMENCGLPLLEIGRMKAQVENQLSMKALVDGGDYQLIRWFHDNGLPQVVHFEHEVFRYD